MERRRIQQWLRETDSRRLAELWRLADVRRRACVGEAVHLRGLVEVSNRCMRQCLYCGLRAGNPDVQRYTLTAEEILDCGKLAEHLGFGTVVLQAGEHACIGADWMADVIRGIKSDTSLAVTLSLGERSDDDLARWRDAGADRYLLRFETSRRELYEAIHPGLPGVRSDRFAILDGLRRLGYEVGSGVMVGIPGQSYDDLLEDLLHFRTLELDMIGVGPYIAHANTPMGRGEGPEPRSPGEQVPNDAVTTCKVFALVRLLCPHVNIPSTTALATLDPEQGLESGLACGANVVMPNLTPAPYRAAYEIYPNKGSFPAGPEEHARRTMERIERLGRPLGVGRGDSIHYKNRCDVRVAR